MSIFHDEIEIEDMEYDEETETYYYPCPCGDRFQITRVSDGFIPNFSPVCYDYCHWLSGWECSSSFTEWALTPSFTIPVE